MSSGAYELNHKGASDVKNQRIIHRSMQCFIDGQENGNLALETEQCLELVYLKSEDKCMVSFCCVV